MLPRIEVRERQTPLELSVDAGEDSWLVSWNPDATSITIARAARLYVVSGGRRRKIDLSPGDLARGAYLHPYLPDDATFRLEIDERTGHVAAESIRLVHR